DLNLQSWMANWELDVAIEDPAFGAEMERLFLRDLGNSTEVVLHSRRIHRSGHASGESEPGSAAPDGGGAPRRRMRRGDASGRAAASALRIGHTVGAALTATRPLGAAEAPTLAVGGGLLVVLGAVAAWEPALLAYPVAAAGAWVGVTLLWAAWRATRPPQDQNPPG
ncbi:MAG TPA: hypothetical protein VMW48_16425, partial [Vicinamibacterales bacterium]|nr:hypothetical protein [Vicinamibacterales bacterium]